MNVALDDAQVLRLTRLSRAGAAAAAAIACTVLVGWALGISAISGSVGMKVTTAVAFVLVAVPLLLVSTTRRPPVALGYVCSVSVMLLAIATLAQYVGGSDMATAREAIGGAAGRMGPATAVGLGLLALAMMGSTHRRTIFWAQWLALAAAFLGLLNLVGYVHRAYGSSAMYSPAARFTEMAVATAVGFVLLGASLLCAHPRDGMMAVVTSPTVGGTVARRLLPAAVVIPIVLGGIRLVGERRGVWSFETGWALLSVSSLAVFVVIVWRSAAVLHRTDIYRRHAEVTLRRAHSELEARISERTMELQDSVHALKVEIQERRRAEEALHDSERRYRTLIDSSRGLICVHALDGTLLSINPAAAQALGYTPDELCGKNLVDLLAPSVRDLFPAYLDRMRASGADEGSMRLVARGGEERVWTYSNVRYEETDRPPYVLGHAQDITELRRAAKLKRETEALRSVTLLANAAAHEINNPLAIIAGQLEMLKRSKAMDAVALGRISDAEEAIRRITDIITKMTRITHLRRAEISRNLPPLLDLHQSDTPPGDESRL